MDQKESIKKLQKIKGLIEKNIEHTKLSTKNDSKNEIKDPINSFKSKKGHEFSPIQKDVKRTFEKNQFQNTSIDFENSFVSQTGYQDQQ